MSEFADKAEVCAKARKGLVQAIVEKAKAGGTTAKVAALDTVAGLYPQDQAIHDYAQFLRGVYLQTPPAAIDPADTSCALDFERKAEGAYARAEYAEAAYLYRQYYRKFLGCESHPACRQANARALLRIGQSYLGMGESQSARAWFGQAIARYPDDPASCAEAQTLVAQAYQQEGRLSAAVDALDKLVSDYSPQADQREQALMTKSWYQMQARRFKEAAATIQQLTADRPDSANRRQAEILLQDATLSSGKRTEALQGLRRLLSDPAYSRDELGRINLLIGIGSLAVDRTGAEEQLGSVISQFADTKNAQEAYLHRSLLRVMRGAYGEAAADIENIRMPAWRHYAQGYLLYNQGDYAGAAASFAQVVPSLPTPLNVPWDIPIRSFWYLQKCCERTGDSAGAAQARAGLAEFKARLPLTDPDVVQGGKAR